MTTSSPVQEQAQALPTAKPRLTRKKLRAWLQSKAPHEFVGEVLNPNGCLLATYFREQYPQANRATVRMTHTYGKQELHVKLYRKPFDPFSPNPEPPVHWTYGPTFYRLAKRFDDSKRYYQPVTAKEALALLDEDTTDDDR